MPTEDAGQCLVRAGVMVLLGMGPQGLASGMSPPDRADG
jgi:hypothetical protein